MREIFYELIQEAANAKVFIDREDWPIGFNTNIEGKFYGSKHNLSTLVINDKEEFFKILEIYVEKELEIKRKHMPFVFDIKKSHIKSLITYLIVNMSTEDFLNPVEAIRRRIGFIEDTTFSLFDETVPFKALHGSDYRIKQNMQSIYMETPYIMDFSIVKDDDKVKLPYISYGITEENGEKVCYIYSIMNHQETAKEIENKSPLRKKVNRLFFKLNKGVLDIESKEYKEYMSGESDYYPENISDVSPSFIFVAVTFLLLLKSKGIEKVKIVPYLPVRYLARDVAARRTNDKDKRAAKEERNNMIQTNATEKFLRTFRRAAYHIMGTEIVSYPYEVDECLTLRLNGKEVNNELFSDVETMTKK